MKQGYYPDTVMELQQLRQSAQQPQTYVPVQRNPMKVAKRKRSTLLLISLVLGALFSVVLASVTFGQTDKILSQTATTAEDVGFQLGTMIGTALMIPQMIAAGIAVILNGAGWGTNSRGLSLAGAILYCVAALLMIVNILFLLPSIMLSFVGYSKLKKK